MHLFVKTPELEVSAVAVGESMAEAWTVERFSTALREVGVLNVGIGPNAEIWFREVGDLIPAKAGSYETYIKVRGEEPDARLCHGRAIARTIEIHQAFR